MPKTDICFVGLGYIGLPTAVVMANSGLNVIGLDVKAENIERINRGEVTIVEPGLDNALKTAITSGNLRATMEAPEASAYILAVPTPFGPNHECDMSYIFSAVESIAPKLQGGEIIILESTSAPLTTQKMADRILDLRPDLAADGSENLEGKPVLYFAHCPERILPGNALEELVSNDRIIGGITPTATERAISIYKSFCRGELLETNAVTAEMAKLTENSFRDVNIAFANELSIISDNLGINVWELISLANHHPRVNILQPGPGVGGHCIAVDPWFIVAADPQNSNIIRTAREVNDSKPSWVLEKIRSAVKAKGAKKIALLGLAFKADIDDLRESPAVSIAHTVAVDFPHLEIVAVEPNISILPTEFNRYGNFKLEELKNAIVDSDVIVLLVDHKEFHELELNNLINSVLIDTKGVWNTPNS